MDDLTYELLSCYSVATTCSVLAKLLERARKRSAASWRFSIGFGKMGWSPT